MANASKSRGSAAARSGRSTRAARLSAGILAALVVSTPDAAPTAPAPDAMRPAYATAGDVADGKRVAEQCQACHGAAGISAAAGVPHIAGQRPAYLFNRIRAYRNGAHGDRPMERAVRFLNDEALVKVAAYYASLDPALPAAAPATGKAAVPVDPVAAGRNAAAACGGCHGEHGVTSTAGAPSLTGFSEKYFVAAMNAYRSGARRHDLMTMVAATASETDVKHMALYYALQKPAAAATPSAGNAAAGKAASAACAGCHGERGVATDPALPSLAGQDAQYFVDAMRAYQEGARSDATMKQAAAGLDAAALADLAAYYAAQPPQAPKVVRPLTLAEWTVRCDRCHGPNGNSTDPHTPAIAAQRLDYLQQAIRAYQAGQRRSTTMAAMSASLTDADVAALAGHYARQKARAVVFVMLPRP